MKTELDQKELSFELIPTKDNHDFDLRITVSDPVMRYQCSHVFEGITSQDIDTLFEELMVVRHSLKRVETELG